MRVTVHYSHLHESRSLAVTSLMLGAPFAVFYILVLSPKL